MPPRTPVTPDEFHLPHAKDPLAKALIIHPMVQQYLPVKGVFPEIPEYPKGDAEQVEVAFDCCEVDSAFEEEPAMRVHRVPVSFSLPICG
jgi:hypothetical protein